MKQSFLRPLLIPLLSLALLGFSMTFAASPPAQSEGNMTLSAGSFVPAASQPLPTLSLAPAVVMVQCKPGQSVTHVLRISNQTNHDFAFEMEARDVVVVEGKRVFMPAGEALHSIAATAVFSQRQGTARPGEAVSIQATFTVPQETPVRAVVALFRGISKIPATGSVAMTASLGTLITFELSAEVKLSSDEVVVIPQSAATDLAVEQWLTNTGFEPVVPRGVAVVLNAAGTLVGRASFEARRLLPGERQLFKADFPLELKQGRYRALASFEFNGKTMTNATQFTVP
jgi:hypothetical protein